MAFWNDPANLLPKQAHRWVVSFGNNDIRNASQEDANKNYIPYYFAKSVDKPSYEIGIQEAKYLYSHTFKFPKRVTWKPITMVFYDTMIRSSTINNFKALVTQKKLTKINEINDPDDITQKRKIIYGKTDTYNGGEYTIQNSAGSIVSTNENIKSTSFASKIKISGDALDKQEKFNLNLSTQNIFARFLQDIGYVPPIDDSLEKFASFRTFNFKNDMINSFVGTGSYVGIYELDENGSYISSWNLKNPLISNVSFDRLDYSSEEILKITLTIHYDWAELDAVSVDSFTANITSSFEYLKEQPVVPPPAATVEPPKPVPTVARPLTQSADTELDSLDQPETANPSPVSGRTVTIYRMGPIELPSLDSLPGSEARDREFEEMSPPEP